MSTLKQTIKGLYPSFGFVADCAALESIPVKLGTAAVEILNIFSSSNRWRGGGESAVIEETLNSIFIASEWGCALIANYVL